jgi:predicted transposase/invertase (TIGR01784 family)
MTIAEKLRERGREIGKLKAKQEVALRMLQEGTETTFIAKVTNLPVADIGRLRTLLANNDL